MKTFVCPRCGGNLSAQEASDGWCEGCGKQLPAGYVGGAHRSARQERKEEEARQQAAAHPPRPWRRVAHDLFLMLRGLWGAPRPR